MKFTTNTKVLKTMMEKGMTVINKKSSLPALKRLYFEVCEDGLLKVSATNMEHYVEIKTDNIFDEKIGCIAVDMDDVKAFTKMSGTITFEDTSEENKTQISIKCGKKTLTIPGYKNDDVCFPVMDNTEKKVLFMNECWLLETTTNLETFTGTEKSNNKMCEYFNFNTEENRVETIDGSRIGIRKIENEMVLLNDESVKLHNMCVPVFKKLLDKKEEKQVIISQDAKHVKVEGNDFVYITRKFEAPYFKTEQMLRFHPEFTFTVDRGIFLDIMKYNADLKKTDKNLDRPTIFTSKNGNMYSYINTGRYESFDEIETENNTMKNSFYIGFNPSFLADVFKIVDSENPVCEGTNPKAPLLVKGNEYTFIVLPISLDRIDCEKLFKKYINLSEAA